MGTGVGVAGAVGVTLGGCAAGVAGDVGSGVVTGEGDAAGGELVHATQSVAAIDAARKVDSRAWRGEAERRLSGMAARRADARSGSVVVAAGRRVDSEARASADSVREEPTWA